MKKVIVILGPTGVGKTKLSIQIAKMINGEIISGDSVQVYRRLDIGSAKIMNSEMEGIKHHLIDILDPTEEFSVADFQSLVRAKLDEIDYPIICGGTGLYIDAAIRDYRFDGGKRNEEFLSQFDDLSNDELYELLLSKDPNASYIHKNNRKRVLRALEVCLCSDNCISDNRNGHQLVYDCLILGLTMERETLYNRINQRVDQMVLDGLIDEVKNLYDEGIMVNAIGYKELYPYFENKISLEEAISDIKKASRHYAKRQMTWFRHNDDIKMIDMASENAISECINLVNNFLEER